MVGLTGESVRNLGDRPDCAPRTLKERRRGHLPKLRFLVSLRGGSVRFQCRRRRSDGESHRMAYPKVSLHGIYAERRVQCALAGHMRASPLSTDIMKYYRLETTLDRKYLILVLGSSIEPCT